MSVDLPEGGEPEPRASSAAVERLWASARAAILPEVQALVAQRMTISWFIVSLWALESV